MAQTAIFGPMLLMMILTLAVWIYMFARRIPFIQRSNLTPEQFEPTTFAELQPPEVSNPSDNLKNLFELPVVFYALCLYLFVTGTVDGVQVALAWGFAVLRIAHSLVHCTFNHVVTRFAIYAAASVCLWGMLALAGWRYLSGSP